MPEHWTKYLHDDVPGFGALPHGLHVSWYDARDHGAAYGWEADRYVTRSGYAQVATARQALQLALLMDEAGMTEVQIGGLAEDEATDVVDDSFAFLGIDAVTTSYDDKTGWWYVALAGEA